MYRPPPGAPLSDHWLSTVKWAINNLDSFLVYFDYKNIFFSFLWQNNTIGIILLTLLETYQEIKCFVSVRLPLEAVSDPSDH